MPTELPFCTDCGTRNEADAVFCERCGHPLAEAQAAPAASGESASASELRRRSRWPVALVGVLVLAGFAYTRREPLSSFLASLAAPPSPSAQSVMPVDSQLVSIDSISSVPPPTSGTARPRPPAPPLGPHTSTVTRPPSGPTSPVARTGKQFLQLDQLLLGWLASDAFQSAGVRWTQGEGNPRIDEPEPNMVLPSGRSRVLLLHGGPVTSLTMEFIPPVKRFGLTRIGTAGGASVPTWTLEAFDARGQKVGSTGEEHGLPLEPRQFSVAADEIVRVLLRTDNRFGQGTWATWNSLPVVEFELER